jgi:hypothetical protein
MSAGAAVATPVEIEIIDLRRFFVQWFSGACEDSDRLFEQRLVSRFASDFQIITPGGALLEGAALWSAMRSAWGSNPGFKIEIRDVRERRVSTTRLVIASYEEWQKNALEATPANNARPPSALLELDDRAPHGLRWLHLHETWLPTNRVAGDPFAF